mgnify:CR=1 FL=1
MKMESVEGIYSRDGKLYFQYTEEKAIEVRLKPHYASDIRKFK